MKRSCVLGLAVVETVLALAGCGSQPEVASEVAPEAYSVSLSVPTKANLPACTSALHGTTAHVASPSGLWSCTPAGWVPLPCTKYTSGAVAYESHSDRLWACVSGSWTEVTLPEGAPGETGPQGEHGETGLSGATSLIDQSAEPAGENCEHGGTKIESGVDLDANGMLDAAEVSATSYVCSGAPGEHGDAGPGSLIAVTPEPRGPNCVNGGQRLDTGLDLDGDDALSTEEIQQTSYVCNGIGGCGDGQVDSALGEVCDHGGVSGGCDSDCTLPACGDGLVNPFAGEGCEPPGTPTCDPHCRVRDPSCEPSVLVLFDRTGSMELYAGHAAEALSYVFTGRGGVHWSLKAFPEAGGGCTLSEGVSVASTLDPYVLDDYLASLQLAGNMAATASAIELSASYLLQGPSGPKTILLISDSEPNCGSNAAEEAIEAAATAAQVGITTHVVDYGRQPDLVALAEASGGEYLELDAALEDRLNQLLDAATACAP